MFKNEQTKAAYVLQAGLIGRKELELAQRLQQTHQGPLEIILWKLGLWNTDQLANFYNLSPTM